MTPKEKAKELVNKYYHLFSVKLENTICNYEAKHCALLAVDEMIEEAYFTDGYYDRQEYWQKVKQEIEKL